MHVEPYMSALEGVSLRKLCTKIYLVYCEILWDVDIYVYGRANYA